MNTAHIPGPFDAEMLLEAAAGVTITASGDGTAKDLGQGYAPGGIGQPVAAVVQVTARDATTGDETYTAVLRESDDGTNWNDAGPIITISAVGTISVPGFLSKRYCRLKATLAGTTPSLTYKAHLVPLGPLA